MKKSFAILALALAPLSQTVLAQEDYDQAYYDETQSVYEEPKPIEGYDYNSFFLQTSFGFLANTVDGYVEKNGNVEGAAFNSKAILFGVNMGINFRRYVDAYLGFDLGTGSGTMKFDRLSEKKSSDYFNFNFHTGFIVFPLSRDPDMYGYYAGVEFGIGIYDVDTNEDFYVSDEFQLDLKLKIGRVWDVSRSVSLGVELFIDFLSFPDDAPDYYWEEMCDLNSRTIGINFSFMRR